MDRRVMHVRTAGGFFLDHRVMFVRQDDLSIPAVRCFSLVVAGDRRPATATARPIFFPLRLLDFCCVVAAVEKKLLVAAGLEAPFACGRDESAGGHPHPSNYFFFSFPD